MPRQNYIYVDYENVHEAELDRLTGKPAHVTLVLGNHHKKLSLALVKLIHKHAEQVNLIETDLIAKNALDFVLACEVGRQTEIDSKGYYYILSKDKGFDAVIHYLKERKILAARRESFSEIRPLMNCTERAEYLKYRFQEGIIAKPTRRKALEASIQSEFGRSLSDKELEETIGALTRQNVIKFDDGEKLTITLSEIAPVVKPVAKKKTAKKVSAKKTAKKATAKKTAKKKAVKKEKVLDEWVEKVDKDFSEHPKTRPKTVDSMLKKIGNIINKPTGGPEVLSVINALCKLNHLSFDTNQAPVYQYKSQ